VNENAPSSGKTRLRRLSAEEIELWLNVTRGVARRPGSPLPPVSVPQKEDVKSAGKAQPSRDLTAPSARATPAPAAPKPPPPLAPLERRLRQKLARGRAAPEAAIDLHGMRRQEAFTALHQFLSRAQREGARLVLVVTGKGERGMSDEPGVLRKSVPTWLRGAQYHSIIVGFEEASRPHGGAGALYVRLKKRDRFTHEKDTP
jgi:DNA-nicking Smr family endonuclease